MYLWSISVTLLPKDLASTPQSLTLNSRKTLRKQLKSLLLSGEMSVCNSHTKPRVCDCVADASPGQPKRRPSNVRVSALLHQGRLHQVGNSSLMQGTLLDDDESDH